MLAIWAPAPSASAFHPFADVNKSSAHYEAIDFLQKNGLIGGYRADKGNQGVLNFKPNEQIKRTEAAATFYRILDLDSPKDHNKIIANFKDIDETHPLVIPIAATIEEEIFKGDNGYFKDVGLNREQMATTIVRAFNLEYNPHHPVKMNLENVSNSHMTAVQTLAQLKITTELNHFRPKEKVTRAQFISFLYRTMKLNGLAQYTDYDIVYETFPNDELFIFTGLFSDSIYIHDNTIHDMIFEKRFDITLTEAKKGAEYAVAFPNTPITTKRALVRHIPQQDNLFFIIKSPYNYANQLLNYEYSEPGQVPLPNGKTIEAIEKQQKEKIAVLEKKNNLTTLHSAYTLFAAYGNRHGAIMQMSDTLHISREEAIRIINWTVETGDVYDGGHFLAYYVFDHGAVLYKN